MPSFRSLFAASAPAIVPAAVLALAALLAVPAALAAPPDPSAEGLSGRERLEALVERVQLEQGQLESLKARFSQRKESELFVEPVEAEGMLYYVSPDRVRWEFETPDPMSVVIADERMTTWFRDLGRAEMASVGRASEQVIGYLGATGSLDTLLQYFRVTAAFPDEADSPYRLDLDPLYDRIERRVRSMSLWIDRSTFLPVRLRWEDGGGDVTDYRFEAMEVNEPIPDERFELDLPEDVEVERVRLDDAAD